MLVMHMKLYNIHTVHERLLTENHLVYVNVSNYANIKVEKNSKSIFTKAWYLSIKVWFWNEDPYLLDYHVILHWILIYTFQKMERTSTARYVVFFRLSDNDLLNLQTF